MQSYRNALKQKIGHYCKQFRRFGCTVSAKDIPKLLYRFLFPNVHYSFNGGMRVMTNFLSIEELSKIAMVCKDVHMRRLLKPKRTTAPST